MAATHDRVVAVGDRSRRWWSPPVRRFVRHYLEMLVAMMVGMATLYPLWTLVADPAAGTWQDRADVEALVMATTMTVPMLAWMLLRGHRGPALVEMAAAMYLGFVVFFPWLWWGDLGESGLMTGGHVAMLLLMLGAMLLRRHEYAGHAAHAPVVSPPRPG